MVYYDHAMVGATVAMAVGAQRRQGWLMVVMAALAAMFPDWDAVFKHISPDTYKIAHRVWGHNLFAVTLVGAALGALGYLIHQSLNTRRPVGPDASSSGVGPWILLCILVMWTHPLFDLLYCGEELNLDWPVRLFWPIVPGGLGLPWMPWSDEGATCILLGGLVVCVLARRHSQLCACVVLVLLASYIGVRGALLHNA